MMIKSIVASLLAVYISGTRVNRLLLEEEDNWLALGVNHYGFVRSGTCESYGYFTISDPEVCQEAAREMTEHQSFMQSDYKFIDHSDEDATDLDRPTGCSYHGFGNVEQWSGINGDCDSSGYYGCFCKLRDESYSCPETSSDTCGYTGTCKYGEETCCGQTYTSKNCWCQPNGKQICIHTEACMNAICATPTLQPSPSPSAYPTVYPRLVAPTASPVGENGCASGKEIYDEDGLCYTECAPLYTGVGSICYEPCPDGYTYEFETFCRKGFSGYLTDSVDRETAVPIVWVGSMLKCPTGYNDYDAGVCYSDCSSGYNAVGSVCLKDCPDGYLVSDDKKTCVSPQQDYTKHFYDRGVGTDPIYTQF